MSLTRMWGNAMPIREEAWAQGTPAWVDLSVTDIERSKKFYSALLGWEFEGGEEEFGGYLNATVKGQTVAGMAPPMEGMDEPVHAWTTYLAVDDSAATEAAISAAGAQVLLGRCRLARWARWRSMRTPLVPCLGPGNRAHTGYNLYNEPGAVLWSEAMVGDFDVAREFYPPSLPTSTRTSPWRM
ncbi:VOC family protein [Ornithinimicrobium sp. INDO-MA30-4]|uniref:VOC family protein n=1 Tax=Ornithinimicrobium sp. INDO-MA30-4 TaxID=2908651 RepID=UPI001F165D83|nr:VOC family protein [Ornithinimicrobium sp. INDO-MA30-4]UJH69942.1 hypothetical protein L0A91_12015 [Ornithinimicrobium sp. INDO-MA30-4]